MATKTKTVRARRSSRQYVVDEKGKRISVVLPIAEYEALIEAAEQVDDVRHLEANRLVPGDPVPLEAAEARLRSRGKVR